MSIELIFCILLLLQGFAMLFDEFYFHLKRGLPLWERVGHPLDTLSVIAVFASLSFLPHAENLPTWLIGLMVFSCLLVTKDEWVHQKNCGGGELWLHSFQFILHPVVFFLAGWVWVDSGPHFLHRIELAVLSVFLIYQILFWNFFHSNQKQAS